MGIVFFGNSELFCVGNLQPFKIFNNMKKTGFVIFLMTVCITLAFSSTTKSENKVKDNWEDVIELSREGGTTRIARTLGIQSFSVKAEPVVEAFMVKNAVTVSVQNYNGPVFVEIYGTKGATSSFIDVFHNGVGVVNLSGLAADKYKVRVTLGDITFTGTIYNDKYGKRK